MLSGGLIIKTVFNLKENNKDRLPTGSKCSFLFGGFIF